MADALKHFFSPRLVRELAASFAAVQPGFRRAAFVREATEGLARLELLDRGRHLARAMARHLPRSFPEAAAVIVRSLGPLIPTPDDADTSSGMAPFRYLPHTMYVAEHGLEHFEEAMRAQYELTQRFSAESSIRPYLERDPERTLGRLREWTRDPSPHVRRLVSEGTRPRLPWAGRLRAFQRDPAPVIALLELLKDDPSPYVRRSVANNLNDIGKDHPAIAIEVCARWLADPSVSDERRALVRHALRSLVKKGDARALTLLGHGAAPRVAIRDVRIQPARVAIGGSIEITFEIESRSSKPQRLLVDYAVHFAKARGTTSEKVFKLRTIELRPKSREPMRAKVRLTVMSTRKPHPGTHAVDALINGTRFPLGSFAVLATKRGS
jgi:3-methyladenine DNA glycosylase AlkC